ncbi:MAG: hypothetical protein AB7O66_11195 [Limisphaerales bacterium]
MKRRTFFEQSARIGALAALGDVGFLGRLPQVTAAEATLAPSAVQLHAAIEPLVRLIEKTPRATLLEEVATRIRQGTSYREILAALFLAGVRNIQPRPVGFKFHAVLVVHSAHLASLAAPDSERWLPLFWALDQFKNSQAADIREGDWALGPVEESKVPPAHRARKAFIEAMDHWDESGADAAVVGLARSAGAHEIFEILCRYGIRDFREIGHKLIYVTNSFRTLEVIGWHHAEPVLRSLAFAILDRDHDRDRGNPARLDLPADRPFRRSIELAREIRPEWLAGEPNPAATHDLLQGIRAGSSDDTSGAVLRWLNRGAAPQSLFDACFDGAGELLMRAPGVLALHATTFTNAVHYAWHHCRDDETRRLLLLQNAAFLPLFRGNNPDNGLHVDTLESIEPSARGADAVAEIFANLREDRPNAARKVLGYLNQGGDPATLADAARRLIFLKGRDSHDYKFSSAVLEDFQNLSAPWRNRFLAASVFNFKGASDPDNALVARTRAALDG